MKRRIIAGFLLLAAIVGAVLLLAPDLIPDSAASIVNGEAAPARVSRSYGFQIPAMTTIRIDCANIDIRLSASDSVRDVTVETYLAGQATDDDRFVVEGTIVDSATLHLRALPTAEWSAQEPGGGRMVVTLPRRVTVAIVSGRGSVMVNEIDGGKKLNIADGDVAIAGGSGSFRIRAPRGNVTLEQYRGSGTIQGGNGVVRTSIVEGRIEATCEGGIEVRGHLGSVELSSTSGGIEAEILRLDSASRIGTVSGNIHLHIPQSLAANLSLSTAPGHLNLAGAPSFPADSFIPFVPLPLNGGGPDLRVESVQGWVRVEG